MAEDDATTLERAGRAAHAAGDYATAADLYEDAFVAYRRSGDLTAAARAARTVGWFRGWVFGDWAVHRGWVARARQLLSQGDDERGRGWVVLDDAQSGNDLAVQRAQYAEAIDVGRRTGDLDLECDATASLGMMLVFSGIVGEGMAHLDEALASICGGDVSELPVVEGCLCGMITACEHTGDVDRAEQWLRASARVLRHGNHVAVAGHCRARYAAILVAAGRWADAEDELVAAIDLLPGASAVRLVAECRLAHLRVRQGRFEEAEELLRGRTDHEDATLPVAALHLARSRPDAALELLERVLAPGLLAAHQEVPLRAVAVEAALAAGDVDAARRSCEALGRLVDDHPTGAVRAVEAAARARLCDALGDPAARMGWHDALTLFVAARMPADAARARLELATLIASDRPGAAIAEAETAWASLTETGDRPGADRAAALLRQLGGTRRTGPQRGAVLTRREDEVLALLALGLSNPEIGERLFISTKTAEHHVGHVLSKLGLRSRAEAAAYAVRRSR